MYVTNSHRSLPLLVRFPVSSLENCKTSTTKTTYNYMHTYI